MECFTGENVGCPEVVQVLGVVAPLPHHRRLDAAGVALGVDANLLGDLDAVGLGYQSGKNIFRSVYGTIFLVCAQQF